MQLRWCDPPEGASPLILGAMAVSLSEPLAFCVPAHALATWTSVVHGELSWDGTPPERLGASPNCALPRQFISGAWQHHQALQASAGSCWMALFLRADAWPLLSDATGLDFKDRYLPELPEGAVQMRAIAQSLLRDRAVAERPAHAGSCGADPTLEEMVVALRGMLDAAAADLAGVVMGEDGRLIDQAFALLEHQDLPAVLKQLQVSERRLQRCFQARLGLSPKRVARLARLQRTLTQWQAQTPDMRGRRSLAVLALDAGYADQAHMARDFRELVGEAPRHLGALPGSNEALLWALRQGSESLAPRLFRGTGAD